MEAISSGLPTLLRGTSFSLIARFSMESPARMAVSTYPGAKTLTLLPSGPTSWANERAQIAKAAFDAE